MESNDSWVTSMLDVEFDSDSAEGPPVSSRTEKSMQGDLVMGLTISHTFITDNHTGK